jgi:hypothetical protein
VTERSRVIVDLSMTIARLVPLERQAFGCPYARQPNVFSGDTRYKGRPPLRTPKPRPRGRRSGPGPSPVPRGRTLPTGGRLDQASHPENRPEDYLVLYIMVIRAFLKNIPGDP